MRPDIVTPFVILASSPCFWRQIRRSDSVKHHNRRQIYSCRPEFDDAHHNRFATKMIRCVLFAVLLACGFHCITAQAWPEQFGAEDQRARRPESPSRARLATELPSATGKVVKCSCIDKKYKECGGRLPSSQGQGAAAILGRCIHRRHNILR